MESYFYVGAFHSNSKCFICFCDLEYFNSVSHKALQEKLIAVASTAAIAINVEEHETIKSQEDISSSAYQNISGFLQKIQKANSGIDAIYTMRKQTMKILWNLLLMPEKKWILMETE